MVALGFLALLQMVFLPGYLLWNRLGLGNENDIRKIIYIFGLSLFANNILVFLLCMAHLYNQQSLLLGIGLELTGIAYLWSKGGLQRFSNFRFGLNQARHNNGMICSATFNFLQFAGIVCLAGFALICMSNFGTVFSNWDDVVSWNRWATEWAQGQIVHSGIYPQLVPVNWSISYVLMQTIDVQMFAKAIMPLFPLFTVALCWDLFIRTKNTTWLFAELILSGFLLTFFYSSLAAGYVDIAVAFFCFLSFHSAVTYEATDNHKESASSLMPLVFACAASATKAGGWYFVALALAWFVAKARKNEIIVTTKHKMAIAGLLAAAAAHYIVQSFINADQFAYLGYLSQQTHSGRNYAERWSFASDQVAEALSTAGRPLFYFVVTLIGIGAGERRNRLLALALALPAYITWALFFSYDQRGLSITLPFAAYLAGSGIVTLSNASAKHIRQAKITADPRVVTAIILLTLLLIDFAIFGSSKVVKKSLLAFCAFPNDILFKPICTLPSVGIATVVFWGARRELKFQFNRWLMLGVTCAAVFVAQATVMKPAEVLRAQQLAQREIMLPELNYRLYALLESGALDGKICTSYLPLKFLPGLRDQYVEPSFLLTEPLKAKAMDQLSEQVNGQFLLAPIQLFTVETDEWMKKHNSHVVFADQCYKLVRLTDFPNSQRECGTGFKKIATVRKEQ